MVVSDLEISLWDKIKPVFPAEARILFRTNKKKQLGLSVTYMISDPKEGLSFRVTNVTF